jgi:hypothetical protein
VENEWTKFLREHGWIVFLEKLTPDTIFDNIEDTTERYYNKLLLAQLFTILKWEVEYENSIVGKLIKRRILLLSLTNQPTGPRDNTQSGNDRKKKIDDHYESFGNFGNSGPINLMQDHEYDVRDRSYIPQGDLHRSPWSGAFSSAPCGQQERQNNPQPFAVGMSTYTLLGSMSQFPNYNSGQASTGALIECAAAESSQPGYEAESATGPYASITISTAPTYASQLNYQNSYGVHHCESTMSHPEDVNTSRVQTLDISDSSAVEAFFKERLRSLTQLVITSLARAWIKAICPNKRSIYPYQDGHINAPKGIPGWWPPKCDFKAPDRIDIDGKPDRYAFCAITD